ncbi:histidine kinase-, DNA gyrase B-, and HSP90-like ATPase family protein [Orientia chuto str. Dubai]|uniref:Histidine kinase-, DNA gyrase B-, and HSP90-like ATPase family protein n=1 Tax=Orientia chuto str. Dubai TaxID=1359168 RepID=A0A0F3MMW5_9RICK|nr:ATP-binding protein [Candidatus Orientia mediorientalis]KJV57060.1 histidine kinase-, DNA gyrase B-, and HSP90-like ATPase family protein [Orientia chuto str. Dubai]
MFRQYIESTNVKSETFSIKALIDNTVSKIKQDFENEDIELNIQNDIQNLVIGDSFRIKAVLSQLIGSAIINSIKNCKIAINVNQNSKILQFTVQNTCLSISKEKLQRINAELENQDLEIYRELGEGLAFIKHLTHQIKGSLRVTEQSNYITFLFEVPIPYKLGSKYEKRKVSKK